MNTNTTTAGNQYLKGAFIVFIEHSKNTFMYAVDLSVCTFITEYPDQGAIINDACSLEIYVYSLENAFIFIFALEHNV